MAWRIEYLSSARRDLRKLDRQVARRILDYMDGRVAKHHDPRGTGRAVVGTPEKLWRYRVGDYRIVCEIRDQALVVLVVAIGHRSSIYE